MIAVAVAMRAQRDHLPRRGQPLVDQDGVVGHRLDHLQRQPVRIDRRRAGVFRNLLDQRLAPRRPVLRRQRRQSLLRARFKRAAARRLQRRHQRAQGLPHVGLERDVGAVIPGEIPIDQADLHDRKPVRQRIGLAVDRHPQRIAAERDDEVVRRERVARDLLDARQRAHEARAFGQELRAIGRRATDTPDSPAFPPVAAASFKRVALDDLVADDDHRPLRFQDARGQRLQRLRPTA